MKKILIILLSSTLLLTTCTFSFAEIVDNELKNDAERNANVVEQIVDMDSVNLEIYNGKNNFKVENSETNILIPKSGDDEIVMGNEYLEPVSMNLPKEVANTKGVLTDEGTIIYDSDEDVNIAIQSLQEENGDVVYDALRTMITIKNAEAPKEFAFKFNLPQGHQLITAKEYYEEYASSVELEEKEQYEEIGNEIYVLNKDNIILQTIDPAWAKDKNGNDVNSYYRIRGNELIQVVEFHENSCFPIVADPTAHPTKASRVYFNKVQVREMAEMYRSQKSSTWWNVGGCISGGSSILAGKLSKSVKLTGRLVKIGYVHLAASCYLTALDVYYDLQFVK